MPFQCDFAVESDLSIIAIQHAVGLWKTNYDSFPSVLWVRPDEYVYANNIVDAGFRHLTVLCDPAYELGWWSVGTRIDRGFGSVGS